VLVTVFGVWLGIKVDQARRQKRAVEALQALGAAKRTLANKGKRSPAVSATRVLCFLCVLLFKNCIKKPVQ
jgi:hypothetical protein